LAARGFTRPADLVVGADLVVVLAESTNDNG
jgi:hypothetical protein